MQVVRRNAGGIIAPRSRELGEGAEVLRRPWRSMLTAGLGGCRGRFLGGGIIIWSNRWQVQVCARSRMSVQSDAGVQA